MKSSFSKGSKSTKDPASKQKPPTGAPKQQQPVQEIQLTTNQPDSSTKLKKDHRIGSDSLSQQQKGSFITQQPQPGNVNLSKVQVSQGPGQQSSYLQKQVQPQVKQNQQQNNNKLSSGKDSKFKQSPEKGARSPRGVRYDDGTQSTLKTNFNEHANLLTQYGGDNKRNTINMGYSRQREELKQGSTEQYESGETGTNKSILKKQTPDAFIIENGNDISEIEHRFGDQEERQMNEKAGLKFLAELLRFQEEQNMLRDQYFAIVEKDSLDRIENINGKCSNFFRCIETVRVQITRLALFIITSKVFETLSICVIVGNSLSLAAQNPLVVNTPALFNDFDYFFIGYYTFEMCLKVCAFGFIINKGSYIRDPWNILDFVIIVTGYVTIFSDGGGSVKLSVLRVFRVLRPLRAISSIKGLKLIMDTLMSAMPLMRDSFIVLFFYYFILAIVGMQLFTGVLKKQCMEIETAAIWPGYSEIIQASDFCGGQSCSPGYVCVKTNSNPNYESFNFDTIFYSLLTAFQSSTGEGWSNNMEAMSLAYSIIGGEVYFQLDNMAGNFFLLNIFTAVICATFADEHEKRDAANQIQLKKKKKKKIDYEDLDDDERAKFLKEQEFIRDMVVQRWRVILFIKRKMRILLAKFRKRHSPNKQPMNIKESSGQTSAEHKIVDIQKRPDKLPQMEDEFRMSTYDQNDENKPISMQFQSRVKYSAGGQQTQSAINEEELESNAAYANQDELASQNSKSRIHKFAGIHKGINKTVTRKPKKYKPISQQFEDFLRLGLKVITDRYSDDKLKQIKDAIEEADRTILDAGSEPDQDDDSDSLGIYEGQDYYKIANEVQTNNLDKLIDESIISNDENFMHGYGTNQPLSAQDMTRNKKTRNASEDQQIKKQNNNEKTVSSDQTDGMQKYSLDELQESPKNRKRNLNTEEQNRSKTTNNKKIGSEFLRNPTFFHSRTSSTGSQPQFRRAVPSIIYSVKEKRRWKNEKIASEMKEEYVFDPDAILNSRTVVEKQIGIHKKLYLLPDKFNFRSQEDIFEQRKKPHPIDEEAPPPPENMATPGGPDNNKVLPEPKKDPKKHDNMIDHKIKPYMKKINMIPKKRHIDQNTFELLLAYQMDEYDFENIIQEKYDLPYLSSYFVTGTISMVLEPKFHSKNINRRKTKTEFKGIEDSIVNSKNSMSAAGSNSQPSGTTGGPPGKRNTLIGSNTSTMKKNLSSAFDIGYIESPTKKFHEFHKNLLFQTLNEIEQNQPQSAFLMAPGINRSLGSSSSLRPIQIQSMMKSRSKMFSQMPGCPGASGGVGGAGMSISRKFIANKATKFTDPTKDLIKFNKQIIKKLSLDLYQSTIFKYAKHNIQNKDEIKFVDTEQLTKKAKGDGQSSEDEEDQKYTFEKPSDEYVDFQMDNSKEIKKAMRDSRHEKKTRYEWSGQDVLEDFDPNIANQIIESMNEIRVWPPGFHGHWKRFRTFFKMWIRNVIFENFLTACVLCNTVILAIDHYGLDANTSNNLTLGNNIFTYIFIIEMGFKLMGFGPFKYMQDKMNYIDATVVIISCVEMGLDATGGGGTSGNKGAFTAIRTIRIFRVVRIARILRAIKSMRAIIFAIVMSLNEFLYLACLLLLFIFIYTLLGMQLFGGKFFWDDDGDGIPEVPPRQNFDNFLEAFYVVFQVLTDENWFMPLYWTMRGAGPWIGAIYSCSWLLVGSYTILNLATAILVDAFMFRDDDEMEREKTPEEIQRELMKYKLEQNSKTGQDLIVLFSKDRMIRRQTQKAIPKGKKKNQKQVKDENVLNESFEVEQQMIQNAKAEVKPQKIMFEGNECMNSLYFFNQKGRFRKFFWNLSTHIALEYTVMIIILLSTLKLVIDTYTARVNTSALITSFSNGFDLFLTAFFCAECAIKVIAQGFIQDKGAYIRDHWQKLDFFIVITSFIDAVSTTVNIPALKILRLLRTLRPLRFLSHNSSMKVLFESLVKTFSNLGSITSVIMIVWLVFIIVGMNLFGGKLYYCNFGPPMGVMDMWRSYKYLDDNSCLQAHGNWLVQDFNFDNLGYGFLDLFDVCSQENWPDTMNECSDLTGTNSGPIWDISALNGLFFILFVFISNFMLINIFLGFLERNFDDAQTESQREQGLNDKQTFWIFMIQEVIKSSPDIETITVPKIEWRKKVHTFITHSEEGSSNKFDLFIMVIIMLNIVQMSANYETASVVYQNGLTYVNYIFTFIFLIEVILKMIAYGRFYTHSAWNVFDCIVVVASVIDIVMSPFISAQYAIIRVIPQLARVLRVFRLFRIFKKFQGLQTLIMTIYLTVPYIINTAALMCLVFFIFAILTCYLFSEITQGSIINGYFNFSTFGYALSYLAKICTGEDWNHTMMDTMRTGPDCIPGITCGWEWSYFIFIPYMILAYFIMENVFQIVTNNAFDIYYMGDNNVLKKFRDNSSTFKKHWTLWTKEYDCQKMKTTKILDFMLNMEEPLGMEGWTPLQAMKEILKMRIAADDDGFVYYNELFYKIMKRVYGDRSVRNTIVAKAELKACQTCFNIRLKVQQLDAKLLKLQDAQANPFLLMMYAKMSLIAWIDFYRRYEKMQKEKRDKGIEQFQKANMEQEEGEGGIKSKEDEPEEEQQELEEEDQDDDGKESDEHDSEYEYLTDREMSCYSSDDDMEGENNYDGADTQFDQNDLNSNRKLLGRPQFLHPFAGQKNKTPKQNKVVNITTEENEAPPSATKKEQVVRFQPSINDMEDQESEEQPAEQQQEKKKLNVSIPEHISTGRPVQKVVFKTEQL